MEKIGTTLVGFSGKIGSGKNTAATIIQLIDVVTDTPALLYGDHPFETIKYILKDDEHIQRTIRSSKWIQTSYAHKLKQICSILTGIPIEKFSDQQFKASLLPKEWMQVGLIPEDDRLMSVRQFIQTVGTEAIRNNVHWNAWVNALFADYIPDANGNDYPKWLITDVRFPNELNAIRERGGVIIRMEREFDHKSDHVSETALDGYPFDFVIDNSGSITDLIKKIIPIFNQIQ